MVTKKLGYRFTSAKENPWFGRICYFLWILPRACGMLTFCFRCFQRITFFSHYIFRQQISSACVVAVKSRPCFISELFTSWAQFHEHLIQINFKPCFSTLFFSCKNSLNSLNSCDMLSRIKCVLLHHFLSFFLKVFQDFHNLCTAQLSL